MHSHRKQTISGWAFLFRMLPLLTACDRCQKLCNWGHIFSSITEGRVIASFSVLCNSEGIISHCPGSRRLDTSTIISMEGCSSFALTIQLFALQFSRTRGPNSPLDSENTRVYLQYPTSCRSQTQQCRLALVETLSRRDVPPFREQAR